MQRLRLLMPSITLAVAMPLAATPTVDPAAELDRIYVIGARVPQTQSKVVNAVGLIERGKIERTQPRDVADLFRYEPAIAVPADAHRFGSSGFNVRGLDGNRVAVELDGVPVADSFRVGDLALAGRDAIDVEAIERVEYLRGPASTLYGSDALAGVITFRTRDPHDIVDSGHAFRLRGSIHSRDDGHRISALGAWADGPHGLLALASQRRADEVENHAGDDAPAANPAERRRSGALLKYAYRADRWRASALLDRTRLDSDTDVRSLVRGPGRFASTTALFAEDMAERERLQLGLDASPGGAIAEWQLRLYRQDSSTAQRSLQTIAAVPPRTPAYFRDRLFTIDQRATGAELVMHSLFDTGPIAHDLVYGLSLRHQHVEQFRDGLQVRLDTGESSNVILGERMPVRDFPNSTTRKEALYVQDDMALGASPFSLLWGLRHERYRLDADADPLFADDFSFVPQDLARSQTTPRVGLRFEPAGGVSLYALWAEGFRAPPYSDVNIALSLPQFNYEVRPNPALRPERSRGVELGLDWQTDHSMLRVALFDNRYSDLIESRANLGTDPLTGAIVFQSINRESARIRGIELAGEWRFDAQWRLHGALAAMHGDDRRRGQPLTSVPPARATLGLQRLGEGAMPTLELLVSAAERRDRFDRSGPALFEAPGHAVADLLADWSIGEHLRLTAGVWNLADRHYWDWNSIVTQPVDSIPPIGFFTAPGRNYAVTLETRW